MSNINKTIYDAIKPHVEDALETIANSPSEIQIEKLEMQLEMIEDKMIKLKELMDNELVKLDSIKHEIDKVDGHITRDTSVQLYRQYGIIKGIMECMAILEMTYE